ncbi:MAG: DNA replication and repair protein RecF [Synergistetes bacterium]|nr:DNA replication and repair protein RecF [Synergistota bacterium]MDW8191771.1 DNA replication and repair protein RecF [Synergistota bacterium]
MKIKALNAVNFRRFKTIELEFGERNLIFGPNGSGKTTILEALYMLCWGRSFRTSRDSEVIRWGERSSFLEGDFDGEEIFNVKLSISSSAKKLQVNGKNIARLKLIGEIPVFFLSPDELSMLDGPPKLRRDFLNRVLSQLEEGYLSNYRIYLKILKEKNAALSKGERISKVLDFLNERLLKVSLHIWESRKRLLDRLSDDEISIVYKPSGLRLELDYEALKKAFSSLREKEIKRGFALFGPHLDEFEIFKKEGFSYRRFSSRGEKKWLMWKLFNKVIALFKSSRRLPIFLVDEIISELDQSKISALREDISSLDVQIFVTTLSKDLIGDDFELFEVENGEVRKYNR